MQAVLLGLEVLATVATHCGGHFVSRRMRDDAWPQLARLLSEGMSTQDRVPRHLQVTGNPLLTAPAASGPTASLHADLEAFAPAHHLRRAHGSAADRSIAPLLPSWPAVSLKVRCAVLRCIAVIASDPQSAPALCLVAHSAVAAAIPFLEPSQPAVLKQTAEDAILAVGCTLEADAVWVMLADLVCGQQHSVALRGAGRGVYGVDNEIFTSRSGSLSTPSVSVLLPPWEQTQDALWGRYCLSGASLSSRWFQPAA